MELDVKQFNKVQLTEIDIYKWLESEKAGHDLGHEAMLEWVKKHAKTFRLEFSELLEKVQKIKMTIRIQRMEEQIESDRLQKIEMESKIKELEEQILIYRMGNMHE